MKILSPTFKGSTTSSPLVIVAPFNVNVAVKSDKVGVTYTAVVTFGTLTLYETTFESNAGVNVPSLNTRSISLASSDAPRDISIVYVVEVTPSAAVTTIVIGFGPTLSGT
ncbi:hypothetical protein D3C76_899060 [compost metagenome]